jgi:ATP-dependent protease ClpP protease subunit
MPGAARRMSSRWFLPVLLCLAACGLRDDAEAPDEIETVELASPEAGGAVSTAPMEATNGTQAPVAPEPPAVKAAQAALDWSAVELVSGKAWIGCELDYAAGDGEQLSGLAREQIDALLQPCAERGVIRLRYQGKIAADFTALVQRVTQLAQDLGIEKRVLDIDSSGGLVEDAMRAGDVIADSHWTVWVREGAVCHSACMFILAAGDVRMISGRVGIHRIIRMSSTATTRLQLNKELRAVYSRVRDYLERNGVAVAVADLMMAVPNRNLRLLTREELREYGLDGINPVQDDLDRLQLMRRCGESFVARRDAFVRAFDARCKRPDLELDALNACGLELRAEFGFPDPVCPAESPLSEFDTAELAIPDGEADTEEATASRDDGNSAADGGTE